MPSFCPSAAGSAHPSIFLHPYLAQARQDAAVDSYHGVPYRYLFILNAVIIVAAAVCGLGFGGYVSINNLITSLQTFGVFSSCYNC